MVDKETKNWEATGKIFIRELAEKMKLKTQSQKRSRNDPFEIDFDKMESTLTYDYLSIETEINTYIEESIVIWCDRELSLFFTLRHNI